MIEDILMRPIRHVFYYYMGIGGDSMTSLNEKFVGTSTMDWGEMKTVSLAWVEF